MREPLFLVGAARRACMIHLIALVAACGPAGWVPAQEGSVQLPSGFRIRTFASGLGSPRFLAHVAKQERATLQLARRAVDLATLPRQIVAPEGIQAED